MFPVAQGQRELVIGDRQTGKSTVLISGAYSQLYRNSLVGHRKTMVSYLSSLGQRVSSSLRGHSALCLNGLSRYLVVLLAAVTDSMTGQYIGPLSVTAIAELGRNLGDNALVTYDDLSKHAVAYRQLCLYLRKPAGREAFPSDVFYLHARILERACCLSHAHGLGSLMSLPVIETLSNDLSAYIATNVISITDGQLYLDVILFGIGACPAVSLEKSVSRVGAKSLDPLFRSLSFRVYGLIAGYRQDHGTSSRSDSVRLRAHRFGLLTRVFTQRSASDRWANTIFIWSLISGYLDLTSPSLIHLLTVLASSLHSSAMAPVWSYQLVVMLSLTAAQSSSLLRMLQHSLPMLSGLLSRMSVLLSLVSHSAGSSVVRDLISSVTWQSSMFSTGSSALVYQF
jgi:F-type H+-transporting ATPase subunit alpha